MTRTEKRGAARIQCHGNTLACKVAHKHLKKEIFIDTTNLPLHSISRMNKEMDDLIRGGISKPRVEIKKKWWQFWK